MDERAVANAFLSILSGNSELRREAETLLSNLEGKEGFYPLLCRLATSNMDLPIRQSAVLLLKNSCKLWDAGKRVEKSKIPIPESDRVFLRSRIVGFLSPSVPIQVRSQFIKIAKTLSKSLCPSQWPELFQQLDQSLFADDRNLLFAGLTLLYQVIKSVCSRLSTVRKAEFVLIQTKYFDRLIQCLTRISPTEENFPCLTLILKSYFKGTFLDYLDTLGTDQCFLAWIRRVQEIFTLSCPDLERKPTSENEKRLTDTHPGWKCKKWCARIVHRCFQREANLPSMSEDLQRITTLFLDNFSQPLTTTSRNLLLRSSDSYLPSSVGKYVWKILALAAKSQYTKGFVQSCAIELITRIMLPQLCRVPEDEVLWGENPIEFIRKENDFFASNSSIKFTAIEFLLALCQDKGMLETVLKLIGDGLSRVVLPLEKEALLLVFGSLASAVAKHRQYSDAVAQGLKLHVISDMHSPLGLLRFRAVWIYGAYADSLINDESHQLHVIRSICQLLLDPDLPVRIEASTTLSKLLKWKCTKRLLEPELESLFNVFMENLDKLDSEELMDSLEALIDNFNTAIIPLALSITEKLSASFTRIAASNTENSEMTATSALSTLIKVTIAVKDHKNILLQISLHLVPILQYTLSPQGKPYFEEGLNLVSDFVCSLDSPNVAHLYQTFPSLVTSLVGQGAEIQPYALDFYEYMFNPLANFMSKDKSAFSRVSGASGIFSIVQALLSLQEASVGYEYHLAGKLLMCLIENYEDVFTQKSTEIVRLVLFFFSRTESAWKLLAVELFSVMCYRNTHLALQGIGEQLENLLRFWFDNLHMFKTKWGRLHMAVAMIAFLRNAGNLPDILTRNINSILKNLIQLLGDIYLVSKAVDDSEEEEEEEDDWSPIEEDRYESPLGAQDQILVLRYTLEVLHQSNPDIWEKLDTSLTDEERSSLKKMIITSLAVVGVSP